MQAIGTEENGDVVAAIGLRELPECQSRETVSHSCCRTQIGSNPMILPTCVSANFVPFAIFGNHVVFSKTVDNTARIVSRWIEGQRFSTDIVGWSSRRAFQSSLWCGSEGKSRCIRPGKEFHAASGLASAREQLKLHLTPILSFIFHSSVLHNHYICPSLLHLTGVLLEESYEHRFQPPFVRVPLDLSHWNAKGKNMQVTRSREMSRNGLAFYRTLPSPPFVFHPIVVIGYQSYRRMSVI